MPNIALKADGFATAYLLRLGNMDIWQPISAAELDALLTAQIADCTPEQQEIFDRCKVTPYLVPIMWP